MSHRYFSFSINHQRQVMSLDQMPKPPKIKKKKRNSRKLAMANRITNPPTNRVFRNRNNVSPPRNRKKPSGNN